MSYTVDYDALDRMTGEIATALSGLINYTDAVDQGLNTLKGTENMSGQTAQRMCDYFECVHRSILLSLLAAAEALRTNWLIYRNAYMGGLDTGLHAHIDTSEIREIDGTLRSYAFGSEDVDSNVRSALSAVSDISNVSFAGMDDVFACHGQIAGGIQQLAEGIEGIESAHASADFSGVIELLQQAKAQITENKGKDTIYKQKFDAAAYSGSEGYIALANAFNALRDETTAKGDDLAKAEAAEEKRSEALQKEYEEFLERQKQAEAAKGIMGGLCIVGALVVTVATVGTGSPVLVATVGGVISGAVIAGTNSAADQYAMGGWSGVDWGSVGKDALIGGIVGGATGFVSAELGPALSDCIGKTNFGTLLSSHPNGAVRLLAGVGVEATAGGLTNMTSGAVGRGIETLLETGDLNQAGAEAFNLEALGKDAIVGSISDGTSEFVSSGLGEVKWIDKLSSSSDLRVSIVTNATIEGGAKVAGGIASRGVSTFAYAEGSGAERMKTALNEAFDGEEVAKDLVKGAGKGTASAIKEHQEAQQQQKLTRQLVEQNVRKMSLPTKDGHWADPDKPGDSMWIPDDDAEFTVKNGTTMTYGELKEKYGIEGIRYNGSEPDFSHLEDSVLKHVELESMPEQRGGAGGSYDSATKAVAKRLGWTEKQVEDYMKENGLTWHECQDRKTVRAVPTEINAGFKHSGGISVERSMGAIGRVIDKKLGGSSMTLMKKGGYSGTIQSGNIDKIKVNLRSEFRAEARAAK